MSTKEIISKVVIFSIIFLSQMESVFPQAIKNLLILEFQNIDKDQAIDYLKPSITDEVRKSLKENFAFRELSAPFLQDLMERNLIDPNEVYTNTVSLQLGRYGNQDIVLSGFYRLDDVDLTITVKIFDVEQKKIYKEFEVKGYADNRLWDSIAEMAQRISEEAKDILPNKNQWQNENRESYTKDYIPYGNNLVSITAGALGALNHDQSSIDENDFFTIRRFGSLLSLDLAFHKKDIVFKNIDLFGFLSYYDNNILIATQVDAGKVATRLRSYSLTGGAGYRFSMFSKILHFIPSLNYGFIIGAMNLDFSSLYTKPIDSEGNQFANKSIDIFTSVIFFNFRTQADFFMRTGLIIDLQQQIFFYQGQFDMFWGIKMGVSYAL